ncbi:carbon-nitrogen hydrolase family protein [Halalkalibacillus halophilus]|uniref:carbon-nitrogen hydrolase family protein n=1 Tax=Halalkalibacillus halophilus TaxID=392827 RepID=UPI0004071FA6|nr:carbon-nitrogen hydrolase family protein [Halalkalibacillus halophilus]
MRITIGQFQPGLGKKQENLLRIKETFQQAYKDSAELVLLPELSLSGYFIQDLDFSVAETIDGESITYIKKLCNTYNLYTLFSFPEKSEDGTLFNSTALISPRGKILTTYRKVHLYGTEKEVFTAGEEYKVIDTPLGRIGLMICYDLDFPEVARVLTLKGADLILVATNNMKPYQSYQEVFLKSRAMENEVPIVLCNRTGWEREFEFFGESAAYDAFGNKIVKLEEKEQISTFDLPLFQKRNVDLEYLENRQSKTYQKLIQ